MNYDIVIIGGGVSGAAAALELARPGVRVAIVDRGEFGRESSWAGAGLLSALPPWGYLPAVSRLLERGRAMFSDWAAMLRDESGVDTEYRVSGMLVLPPFEMSAAQTWADTYAQKCMLVAARMQLPQLETDKDALWLPDVAQVRNPRLLQALRGALTKRRVDILEGCMARSFQVAHQRVEMAETNRGPLYAEVFVVAAGAWSRQLLGESLGGSVPIKPMRGQIVLLKGPPGYLPHIVYSDGIYVIPRDDGHILIGSTLEDVGFDKATTDDARAELLARARAVLPMLANLPTIGHWAGLRPGSPNNVPIIGRHPELANFYMNAGHYRYGVTMAPASAELLADNVLDRPSAIPVTPYGWP